MNEKTGFTESTNLKDRANALAMAQLSCINDGYTWLQAYADLLFVNSIEDSEVFIVVEHLDHLDIEHFHDEVAAEADAIHQVLVDAQKPHDDLLFAKYQGFYEYLFKGPDFGRTHLESQDWNEAYDQGRNEAEALKL